MFSADCVRESDSPRVSHRLEAEARLLTATRV